MTEQPHVEFYIDDSKEYRWRLISSNGRIIADSGEGYVEHDEARAAFRRVVFASNIAWWRLKEDGQP
jgi:hypothetical protein